MLGNLSLKTKLIGAFLVLAVLSAVVGLIGYRGITFAAKAQDKVSSEGIHAVDSLWMLAKGQSDVQRGERTMLLAQATPEEIAAQMKRVKGYLEAAEKGMAKFESIPRNAEEEAAYKELKATWQEWRRLDGEFMAALGSGSSEGKEAAYKLSLGKMRDAFRKCEEQIRKLIEIKLQVLAADDKQFDKDVAWTKGLTLGVVLFSVAAALGLGFWLSLSITGALSRAIGTITENADRVASAASELSASSQSMAEGASEQAASLEESSSAMEEMSAMTRQNAENAAQAKQLADKAGSSVEKANSSMEGMVGSMAQISSKGEEIGKIIKTIDEIAFQTNLLALNAAVEAARAGEAGAGFAVVADEVRNLAQRAAGAAKSTSDLIEQTIREIREGTSLVERTSDDFEDVATNVRKVTELVGEITAASSEQARGITEVGSAISQMDKVTQQSAGNAEEIAASVEDLSGQAGSLQAAVGEIEAVVYGAGAGASGVRKPSGASAPRPPKMRAKRPAALSAPSGRVASGGGKFGAKKAGRNDGPKEPSPEEVFPLEDDDSMTSF
jgi:methyl-accepting chemotaxis protein